MARGHRWATPSRSGRWAWGSLCRVGNQPIASPWVRTPSARPGLLLDASLLRPSRCPHPVSKVCKKMPQHGQSCHSFSTSTGAMLFVNSHKVQSSQSCTITTVRRVCQGVLRAHRGRGRHPRRHARGAGRATARRAVRHALPPAEPVRGCGPRRLAGHLECHRCNTPGQPRNLTVYMGASARPPQMHMQLPRSASEQCSALLPAMLRMLSAARGVSHW